MARSIAFCESSRFYCYQLAGATPKDERDIMAFERLPQQREDLVHARLKPRYDSQCVFMYMVL